MARKKAITHDTINYVGQQISYIHGVQLPKVNAERKSNPISN